METKIENASIEGTYLGREDHNIMTCYLTLSYENAGQGFGGYFLDTYDSNLDRRVGWAFGMQFLMEILDVVEVRSWEELKGKLIRVETQDNKIVAIGHIIKNKWFYPEHNEILQGMATDLVGP